MAVGTVTICWDIEGRSLRGLSDFTGGPTTFLLTRRVLAPSVHGEDGGHGGMLLNSPLLHH